MRQKYARVNKTMKNYIVLVLFLVCSLSVRAQSSRFTIWEQESKDDIRMVPEYGNVKKTSEQIEADKVLIADEIKENGTREKASEALINVGFDYMYKGNLKTAMSRFNQAWLLNPKNENAYWGFGSVYFMLGNDGEALKQLNRGLDVNPNSSNILTDVATIYMGRYANSQHKSDIDKALDLFNKSYKIDPSNQNTLFKLSAAYFFMNDCTNAILYYNKCMKLGGKPVTQEYTDALKQHCKN
jgi:tetratricopeptide (TPR) repeat protein